MLQYKVGAIKVICQAGSITDDCCNAQVLSKIPRRTRILLLTFGAAVSVYSLTHPGGAVSAHMFPGHTIAPPEILDILTQDAREGGCLSPLHSCRTEAEAAIKSLR